jgi:hypothetical protein
MNERGVAEEAGGAMICIALCTIIDSFINQ